MELPEVPLQDHLLHVLLHGLSGLLPVMTDVSPRQVIYQDRAVKTVWLDQKAPVNISDRGHVLTFPAIFEPGRILCRERHLDGFQPTFLRIVDEKFPCP